MRYQTTAVPWVVLVTFASLSCINAPCATPVIIAAIEHGEDLVETSSRIVGRAPLAALSEEVCSNESPCWIVCKEPVTGLEGGMNPRSIDAIKTIGYFTSGKGSDSMCPAAEGQSNKVQHAKRAYVNLPTDSLLFALWMIDPSCYIFYYISERRIHSFRPPPNNDDNRIPYESARGRGAAAAAGEGEREAASGAATSASSATLPPSVTCESELCVHKHNLLHAHN